MRDLPYFPFYPTDFEADTSHLTLEEDGAYNRLLRLCWLTPGCSIPADPAWIARRLRVDAQTFDRVVAPILREFFRRNRGRYYNPRLSTEHATASAAKNGKSRGGQESARRRKVLKENTSDPKTPATSLGDTRASPEPEPEPEEREDGGGGAYARAREAASGDGERDGQGAEVVPLRPNPPQREGQEPSAPRPDPPPETFRERLLAAMGLGPDGVLGPAGRITGTRADMETAGRWMAQGLAEHECVAVVAEVMAGKPDGPPSTFRFFDRAMARLVAAKAQGPLPAAPAPMARGSPVRPPPQHVDTSALVRQALKDIRQ